MNLLNGNHRAQAQFDRSKWHVMFLITAWVLQLALALSLIGLFSWRLANNSSSALETDRKSHDTLAILLYESINVALSFITVLCTFVEIAKFYLESLTPRFMLCSHVIKILCIIITIVFNIIVYVQDDQRYDSIVSLVLGCFSALAYLIMASYSVRKQHYLSTYDVFARPINVRPFGFEADVEHNMSSMDHRDGVRQSIHKHSLSASSRISTDLSDRGSTKMDTLTRTPSLYNHERSTQFEEFIARRSSVKTMHRTNSFRHDSVRIEPLSRAPEVYSCRRNTQFGRPIRRQGSTRSVDEVINDVDDWIGARIGNQNPRADITLPKRASTVQGVRTANGQGLVAVLEEVDITYS